MNIFLKSDEFNSWLINLKDRIAKAKIALRIGRAIAMALTLPKD